MKNWTDVYHKKVIEPEKIETFVRELKNRNESIATLNGSFDLLHAGHLQIIFQASQMADILIVALNSDSSIKKYKSAERPIITLKDRMQMMAALEFVDYVTWFDEINPIEILSRIKPNVHVNGAEYGTHCIEAETVIAHGGKIHIVPLLPGLSTSAILEKITALNTTKV